MTIGLILLGVLAVLIFFGITERFFRKIGLSNWLAFLLVLGLVIGAIVPNISFGAGFSMNLSGFMFPIILVTLLFFTIHKGSEIIRSVMSIIAVAGITVAVRMLIMPSGMAMTITVSVITGIVGATVAYLVGMNRIPTLIGAIGGIVLGDVINNLVIRFALGGTSISLGTTGVFDSLIIATIFSIALIEVIAAMRRTMNRNRISRNVAYESAAMESAEDFHYQKNTDLSVHVSDDEFDSYFDEIE